MTPIMAAAVDAILQLEKKTNKKVVMLKGICINPPGPVIKPV